MKSAARGEVALGGCVLSVDDAAWDCGDCRRQFGSREKAYQATEPRSQASWIELVKTMLPAPVASNAANELLGGEPVAVIVRVTEREVVIMRAGIVWQGPHTSTVQGQPFAKVRLRASAARVAKLIAAAWGQRIAQYRWCPRCQRLAEPEHMLKSVCHGCATRVLGVVF